jgi:hypothetical protein
VRWASDEKVDAAALKRAIDDVVLDFSMSAPRSSALKWEYVELRKYLDRHFEKLESKSGEERGEELSRWLSGEPQLSLRILQHRYRRHLDESGDAPHPPASASGRAIVETHRYLSRGELQRFERKSRLQMRLTQHRELKSRIDEEQALQGALVVALMARYYQRGHGDLPATAETLVGNGLDAFPIDPFSLERKTLRYERTPDGGAVVWSVGRDQTDNRGDVDGGAGRSRTDLGFRIVTAARR